jgi:hypothetical protein
MNLKEFFRTQEVSLPRGGFETAKRTFDQYLQTTFRSYIASVQRIDDPEYPNICKQVEKLLPELKQISRRIVSATKCFLAGYPHQAYRAVKLSLHGAKFQNFITELSSFDPAAPPVPFSPFLEVTFRPSLYRMRPHMELEDVSTLTRKDIFHVPFENRHLVVNQRYSIAGLPCLYLGSSAWICWEELGRPDLNGAVFSSFRFAEKALVLDFQLTPEQAWDIYEGVQTNSKNVDLLQKFSDDFIASYILFWPLIAACSIRVERKEGSFFPQYIVPQLLLQWVTRHRKVDGIRYFSTRAAKPDYFVSLDYVFPTKNIKREGRCSYLQKKLHLLPPVQWGILQLIRSQQRASFWRTTMAGQVQLAESLVIPYRDTEFNQLEEHFAARAESDWGPVED